MSAASHSNPLSNAITGLSAHEVAQRKRAGQVNRTPRSELREYLQIVRRNLLTWFNFIVTPAAIGLFVLEEYPGAIAVSAMAVINTSIGLVQEFRAKIQLDRLSILVESKARVVRDGRVETVPAGAVVLGDVMLLQTGETVIADGPVLAARFLEIDEALLTGESDPVRREPGQPLLSGSVCVAGEGAYRADKVGAEAFANRTSAQARRFEYVDSPLTRVINLLVQLLSYAALGLIAVIAATYLLSGFPKDVEENRRFVRMVAATITSMVPQGMVLTATWSFTLGALRMSRQGAIVQRLNAVETMAAIDVICTDKTGTLTSNRLHLDKIQPAEPALDREAIQHHLRAFASASIDRENKSIQALRAALGGVQVELIDQLPFKSQNRYSAVRLRAEGEERILVLGAFETLRDRVDLAWPDRIADLENQVRELQQAGLRVLLFGAVDMTALPAFPKDPPHLPVVPLRPLAILALGDELRADAGAVLKALHAQGIAFKIVSGDNPETVQATVSTFDLPLAHEPVVSGAELAQAPNREELVVERAVFGRVLPEQKLDIVRTLKRRGFCVAMIGDGVNDVLPIKQADLGIAMGEGSQATKTVAGLVLQDNRFALLPETLEEGRTIVRNLRRASKLFLTKNVYSLILIMASALGLPFPYLPQQVTLLNWLVIGIPAFVMALSRERSTAPTRPRFLREVGSFALRTGIPFALAGLAVLYVARHADEARQRTLLLTTLVLLGITALFRALEDGEARPLRGDNRFRLLGILAIPVYLVAMYWSPAARFFELEQLDVLEWWRVLMIVAGTYWVTALLDRWKPRFG